MGVPSGLDACRIVGAMIAAAVSVLFEVGREVPSQLDACGVSPLIWDRGGSGGPGNREHSEGRTESARCWGRRQHDPGGDQSGNPRPADGQDQGPRETAPGTGGPASSGNGSRQAFCGRDAGDDPNDLEGACRDLSRAYSGRHGARSDPGGTAPDSMTRTGTSKAQEAPRHGWSRVRRRGRSGRPK